MTAYTGPAEIDTVVVGGGQAGLTVGYYLTRKHRPFVILDAYPRVGDAWRNRWDSLLLFTPARYDGLPGMRFPASAGTFIGKDQMADYLESYAHKFELPVCTGVRVIRIARDGDAFLVSTNGGDIRAANVVVAMGNHQVPSTPSFARDLDDGIVQLHSKDYRNPAQLREGPVLLVGVGNSGADIAMEVVRYHPTWLAGKESGAVPFRIEPFIARNGLVRGVRFVGQHVLTVRSPLGRKLRPRLLKTAAPLVRVKPKDLVAAGVQRVGRVTGAEDGLPVLEDGRVLEPANVIWCTGYRPGFSWIDLPILGDRQEPAHEAGIVTQAPGLYFVGLHFLYAMTSDTITGMQRDAKRVVRHLARRAPARTTPLPAGDSTATLTGPIELHDHHQRNTERVA
ncbi:MAG: flavin-containing monooxygenase [Frankiaceae bacterium]